jgi:hypothetical protein
VVIPAAISIVWYSNKYPVNPRNPILANSRKYINIFTVVWVSNYPCKESKEGNMTALFSVCSSRNK